MTRKEIVDFLHEEYGCRKSDMKTIKDMVSIADKYGYTVIKNGVEDYELCEKGVILDFTKPLKINRETPALANNKMYNGVSASLFFDLTQFMGFNIDLWCYLMNKKDGDIIRFDEILSGSTRWCKTNADVVRNFDILTYLGFIQDKEDYIQVYAYPIKGVANGPYKYMMNETVKRFAPYKFVN